MRAVLATLALWAYACADDAADEGSDALDAVGMDAIETTDTPSIGDGVDVAGPPSCGDLPGAYVQVRQPPAAPPYAGTVWFSPDIIDEADPSAFAGLTYSGQGERVMFDRRTGGWETYDAHLFDVRFGSATTVEFQVNPEFAQAEAEAEVLLWAEVVGRLPAFLFADFETVWMHRGDEAFGGGNDNLLIHVDRARIRAAEGTIEEVMVHELTHTSLDSHHAEGSQWEAARAADGMAISTYALDNPLREDLAETVGPYLAVRFRADRLGPGLAASVLDTVPNRVRFLDCLELTMAIMP